MKLTEELDWRSTAIDEEAGIVRGVKLIGTVSSNGRKYPQDVLAAAKPMYEGFGIDLDHVEQGKRKVEHGFGRARNIVLKDDGLYGDVEYLTTHPFAPQFVEQAKRMPEQLGMSHSVFAEVRKEGDTEVVESIEKLDSLDLVRRPATTKGLFESEKDDSKGENRTPFFTSIEEVLMDDNLSDDDMKQKLAEMIKPPKSAEAFQPGPSPDTVSIKAAIIELKNQNISLLARFERVDCLTTNDIDRTKLTENQIQEFESKKTREEMDSFVESLPKVTKYSHGVSGPSGGGGRVVGSYTEQRKSLESSHGFKA